MSSPEHAKESRKGRLPMLEAKKLFPLVLVLTRGENTASKASRWGATRVEAWHPEFGIKVVPVELVHG